MAWHLKSQVTTCVPFCKSRESLRPPQTQGKELGPPLLWGTVRPHGEEHVSWEKLWPLWKYNLPHSLTSLSLKVLYPEKKSVSSHQPPKTAGKSRRPSGIP